MAAILAREHDRARSRLDAFDRRLDITGDDARRVAAHDRRGSPRPIERIGRNHQSGRFDRKRLGERINNRNAVQVEQGRVQGGRCGDAALLRRDAAVDAAHHAARFGHDQLAGGAVPGVISNPTPAKVISMSLGGSGACSALEQSRINAARALGVTIVVAAGNESGPVDAPANCAGAIAVTAHTVEGDSAFGFSGMEVETICRYNLPVCIVIFNNDGIYRGTDVNKAGSDPAPTVFVKGSRYDNMMEAFGGVGVNATTPDELKRAVNAAIDSRKPTLINAVIDPAAGSESGRIGNLNPQSKLKKK